MTAASSVKMPISAVEEEEHDRHATMKAMLYQPIRHTDASARSGRAAPRFWPTSVAAALDMPHAGISVNIMMRMAMVAPATASLPMPARMRMRKIHEVMPRSSGRYRPARCARCAA